MRSFFDHASIWLGLALFLAFMVAMGAVFVIGIAIWVITGTVAIALEALGRLGIRNVFKLSQKVRSCS